MLCYNYTMNIITVAIPVYNSKAEHLERLFLSLSNQTLKEFEILICNDGSTNKETLEFLSKIESNITLINSETNKGIYETRNILIKECKTKYISFVDSDDLIPNDYLEKLYEPISGKSGIMTFCWFERFIDDIEYDFKEKDNVIYTDNLIDLAVTGKFGHSICGRIFETAVLKKWEITREKGFDDSQLVPVIASSVNKVIKVNNTVYYYRITENSIMNLNHDPLLQAYRTYKFYLDYFQPISKKSEIYLDVMINLTLLKLYAISNKSSYTKKDIVNCKKILRKHIFKLRKAGINFNLRLQIFFILLSFRCFRKKYLKKRSGAIKV